MIKIIIVGAGGRMGKAIASIAEEKKQQFKIVAGVDRELISLGFPTVTSLEELEVGCDVIIDFSSPILLDSVLEYGVKNNTPLVLATTGYDQGQIEKIKNTAEKVPVFFTANMSLGVNLMVELTRKASKVLGLDYDIEIIEKHHNQKLDAPSGTALLLANEINDENDGKYNYVYDRSQKSEKRSENEIGISAVRGGTIIGEHDVIFAGMDEVLTISHTAYSRNVFAAGALKAAEFIQSRQSGLYSMKDLI